MSRRIRHAVSSGNYSARTRTDRRAHEGDLVRVYSPSGRVLGDARVVLVAENSAKEIEVRFISGKPGVSKRKQVEARCVRPID